ncbi:MAG: sigma-70 family RNA polymerase sigma factor [Bacteroidetes bacterium]|nr:sigma-70 family RNA polymerase sigma factor [Bacteroidota bacterium]
MDEKYLEGLNPLLSEKAVYDFHLIRRAIDEKDETAYTELMGRYRESIFYMMLKMVRNGDDAEDLTIEAFGKAFKNLVQYTPNYAFSTWLFKIATNNAIDFIRKQKLKAISIDQQYETAEGVPVTIEPKSTSLDPEERYIKKQKQKALRAIIEKLKPKYRMLVELRFYKELAYEEIAAEMKIPVGTVKAQLYRAKELLFEIIKKQTEPI